VTVTARPNRNKTDAPQKTTKSQGGAKSRDSSKKDAGRKAARTPGFVRLADVAIAWQTDGHWCGVAALDIEPGGAAQLDLRLPEGCELIQASVEDMPVVPKRIGDGVWRLAPCVVRVAATGRRDLPGRHSDMRIGLAFVRIAHSRQSASTTDPLDGVLAAVIDG